MTAAGGDGFHLFTDRFYTGCQLAHELLQLRVHLTGTVQRNRKGLSKEAKKKRKLKKHEVVGYTQRSKLMFLVWQDKRPFLMLTTYHDANVQTVSRTSRCGTVTFEKQICIIDYTSKRKAVDRRDHLCTSYNFTKKTLKWWRKMFFWLLEVAIVNCYVLCNAVRVKNGSKKHLLYRKLLINELVGTARRPNENVEGSVLKILQSDSIKNNILLSQILENRKTVLCATIETKLKERRLCIVLLQNVLQKARSPSS